MKDKTNLREDTSKKPSGVLDAVKGFRDIEDASKRIAIRDTIESVFQMYNFKAVETPVIEYEEFMKKGNSNDEAVSDTFKLTDKGKRKLALRYEFTFQLKRLAKNKKLPYKRYQIGPVFRDEPITGNRLRQFTQCDCDIVGSTIKDEAEILRIIVDILTKLKIKAVININNRKLLNEILDGLNVKEKDRESVIREIDKLDKISEKEVKDNLKKFKAEKVLAVFKKSQSYFKKYDSFKEVEDLEKFCKLYGVKVNFQPFLARGLSYYNGTVYEVKAENEVKETIAAGGSYPVNGIQATGIAFGPDRLELLTNILFLSKKVLVLSLGQDKKAIEIADKIRSLGLPCQIFYNKVGKGLEYANSLEFPYVVFIGSEETKKKKLKIKDMKTGEEKLVDEKDLEKEINNL